MGEIFCQVIRIIELIHLNPSMISGNQKWRGAAPIFNKSAEFIKKFIDQLISNEIFLIMELFKRVEIILNRKIADPID